MGTAALFLVIGLFFQFILAVFTASDARSRGHSAASWFILVLLFGIFAVLVYLLGRNDEKLSKSERIAHSEKRKRKRTTTIPPTIYIVVVILGASIGFAVGSAVDTMAFPKKDIFGDCDTINVRFSPTDQSELNKPCVMSHENWQEQKQARSAAKANRRNLRIGSSLLGLTIPPAIVYLWGKRRYS